MQLPLQNFRKNVHKSLIHMEAASPKMRNRHFGVELGGHEIKKVRAIALKSRTALLAETAPQVHIRATGHGWCLAQEKGCGGAGLYETTRCVGCKNGVIDQSFADVWRGIYDQQNELLAIDDAGPAVKQRAERDVQWARQVMVDLGVLPQASCASNLSGASNE